MHMKLRHSDVSPMKAINLIHRNGPETAKSDVSNTNKNMIVLLKTKTI